MRRLFYQLLPVYLILFVLVAGLKIVYAPTPMSIVIKAYFIGNLFLMATYILFRDRIVVFPEIVLFCLFAIISISIGLISYGVRVESLSHFFSILTPIFGMSFGYKLGENFKRDKAEYIVEHVMKLAYWSNIVIIVLFQIFVSLGIAQSSQLAPAGLILSSLYYLTKKDIKKPIIGVIFIILSGKRASLVMVIFGILVYLNDIRKNRTLDKKIIKLFVKITTIMSIVIGSISFYLWNYTRFLNRFKLVLKFDISDPHAMYVATGGRSEEIINIIKFMNDNPMRYLFGAGFGVKVEVMDNFYRHYSHFSPLSYTLIFGVIFSTIVYIRFFTQILRKTDMDSPIYPFRVMFSGLFISSFFGAIIMNDVVFWVFYGVTIFMNTNYNNSKLNIRGPI